MDHPNRVRTGEVNGWDISLSRGTKRNCVYLLSLAWPCWVHRDGMHIVVSPSSPLYIGFLDLLDALDELHSPSLLLTFTCDPHLSITRRVFLSPVDICQQDKIDTPENASETTACTTSTSYECILATYDITEYAWRDERSRIRSFGRSEDTRRQERGRRCVGSCKCFPPYRCFPDMERYIGRYG
jgi:hypothetical protein